LPGGVVVIGVALHSKGFGLDHKLHITGMNETVEIILGLVR
jgi:hypothetical protein